jgi:undecaprenyl diphosphate synthase
MYKKNEMPSHIAIIMDGNGRWAKKKNLPRIEGHKAAIEAVRSTVEASAKLKIKYLSLFAFSTENWKRPKEEITALMELLKIYLDKELETMIKNNISFNYIGRIEGLDKEVQKKLSYTKEITKNNDGLKLYLALNYSGRAEIIDAIKKILKNPPKKIDENVIPKYFYDPLLPEPDLLIRTSGEMRISNFFLWQIAYTEIYVTPVLWPDFREKDLLEAIKDYQRRERRFGGIF